MTEDVLDDDNIIDSEELKAPEISMEEIKDVLSDIEIKLDEQVDSESVVCIAPKKNTDVKKLSISEETKKLYLEFNDFLETKADVKDNAETKSVIPTGIDLLDAILGGGFVIGGMTVIVGPPGGFKSTLAAQFMGNAQRIYNGEILGTYADSEESATATRLANLGVRYPKIKPKTQITIEKLFKILEGLCAFKQLKKINDKPSVLIWDSLANTLSQKEIEAEDPNSVIGYKARLLSLLIPKYAAKSAKHNICFVVINQLRDKLQMGQFAPKADLRFLSHSKDMPGGTAVKYNAFTLLEMNMDKILEADKLYGFDGMTVTAKTVKCKLFNANIKVELVVNPNSGFSNFWSNYRFLVETKRISSGAWNTMITLPEKKFRTKDAETIYNTEPEFKQKFDVLVKEAIQKEIIDRYNPNNLFDEE